MIVVRDKGHRLVEGNTFLGSVYRKSQRPRFLTKDEWKKRLTEKVDIDCVWCHCLTKAEEYGAYCYRASLICGVDNLDLWVTETYDDGAEIMLEQKKKYERYTNIRNYEIIASSE